MNKQSILACAVATVLAVPAYAAIDGDGMAYVSASEGLSGTILVNVFQDTDEDNVDASTKLHEMVIQYNGSADLGGGMKSLYNLKLLGTQDKLVTDVSATKTGSNVTDVNTSKSGGFVIDQYFLGVAAPFGTVWAGKVAGVTDANVPGGSLDSVAGSSDVGLTGNNEGQLRYESPRINGLKLGISGVLNGSNAVTGSLDEINLMAHYELPIGLVMALGYESKDRVASPGSTAVESAVSDKASGFRFGATYSQDNWTVAYNYRKYNEHQGFAGETLALVDNKTLNRNNSTTEYQGHRMAAKFVVDRVTMSANYSTETVSSDIPAGIGDVRNAEVSRTTLGVDAKYSLGAKSWMALGHQNKDTEAYSDLGSDGDLTSGDTPVSTKVGTTTLRYGVNF